MLNCGNREEDSEDENFNSASSGRRDTMDQNMVIERGYYFFQDWIEAPRPCYYLLRGLGIWQPSNALCIFKLYSNVIWLFWAAFVVAVFLQYYLHDGTFKFGRILNNLGTMFHFCIPLLFLKHYLKFGNYEGLVAYVYEISGAEERNLLEKIRHIYTCLSFLIWITVIVFYILHWYQFWNTLWQYIVYIFIIIYCMGWASVWVSWYAFLCHVHWCQISLYKKHMIESLKGTSDSTVVVEEQRISRLLHQFNGLQSKLHRTQCDFSVITSIGVAYQIVDMFVFTLAYFKNDFTKDYSIWNYYGTIFFNAASILMTLFPAASVSQALHNTVIAAGDQCIMLPSSSGNNYKIPYERFKFFQHLSFREQDMGFRILGVKITFRLTFGIVVTLGSALFGFLRLLKM